MITQPQPLILTDTVIQITCANANDGVVRVNTTGGTGSPASFNYAWSPTGPNSPINTALQAGLYSLIVTDANSCTATISARIINPAPLTVTHVATNPRCFGNADASISLNVNGGTPQYSYSWSGTSGGQSVSFLLAGIYAVTVTDDHQCSSIDSITLVDPAALFISGIVTDVSCYGKSDGNIITTGYGGTLPYTYQWHYDSINGSFGPVTKDIVNSPGANLFIIMTDANNCSASFNGNIKHPDSLHISIATTPATCAGQSNGSLLATITGGTIPYQYLWNNFSTDSSQSGLMGGSYNLLVTDSKGCRKSGVADIIQPAPIKLSTSSFSPTCAEYNNGYIVLNVQGGITPYTYNWNTTPAQLTRNLSSLYAGTYSVVVTDSNGCRQTDSVTLTAPLPLSASTATTGPTCAGSMTGAISINAQGGTLPYAYSWNTAPAQTAFEAVKLGAGTYIATITDGHGCQLKDTATITEPSPISITFGVGSSTCANTAQGLAVINATGGTAPYMYALGSMIQANDTFTNLAIGNYVVQVTDVNNCHGTVPLAISAPGTLTVSLTATPDVILASEPIQLNAFTTSDTTITSIIWSPTDSLNFSGCGRADSCTAPIATPSHTMEYIVTVINARGCAVSDTVKVTVSDHPSSFVPAAFSPNGDGLNDRFQFDILGAKTINVQIWNRWGEKVFSDPEQANGVDGTVSKGWDGTFRGHDVEFDTYTYQLDITYFDGHKESKAGTVTIMR